MARFTVKVRYMMERSINVYARDDQEAEEKAVEIVEDWKGVTDAEAIEIEREASL